MRRRNIPATNEASVGHVAEGSVRLERERLPTSRFDRESLGRYLIGNGRGHTIRMGNGVIEDTTSKRVPDSSLLSTDSLP